jgi:hypothetical protein
MKRDITCMGSDLDEAAEGLGKQIGIRRLKGKSILGVAQFERALPEETEGSYEEMTKMDSEWRAKGGETLLIHSLIGKPSKLSRFSIYMGLSCVLGETSYIEELSSRLEGIKVWGVIN